jgi:hypothetical protein
MGCTTNSRSNKTPHDCYDTFSRSQYSDVNLLRCCPCSRQLSLFFSQNQIGCNWKQQEAKICYRIDVSCYSIIVWCGGLFIERGIRLHGSTANFNSTLFYASHTLFSGGLEFRFSGPRAKCKQTDVIRTGWHKKNSSRACQHVP